MQSLLISIITFLFTVAQAAPIKRAYVYVTENEPVYVTKYVDGAQPGDPDLVFSTMSGEPHYTTLYPEYSTVFVSTTPEPAPTNGPNVVTEVVTRTETVHKDTVVPPPPPPTDTFVPPPPPPPETSTYVPPPPPPETSTYVPPPPPPTPTSGPMITAIPSVIVYSPYNNDHSCKDKDTVYNDLQYIKSKGVSRIRMYATDCGTLETVQPACQALGISIIQGVWVGHLGLDNADNSINDIIAWAAPNGWGLIEKIIIGNEDVTNGLVSAHDLVWRSKQMRSRLRNAGFNGPVLTAETTGAFLDNPELCDTGAFDIVGLNAHSYFNGAISADQSGDFIIDQQQIVSNLCHNAVWITETGYPSQGVSLGLQVPSKENQAIAVNSILDKLHNDVILLTTFDDYWKDPGPYGIEQHFGVADILF